ncbi:MAG: nitric oxide synthase, partial [Candidatus Latescibacteria bacterium]|nr:nitric oxide synthase [bacterium]MBD3425412.1 nitric oxide synthase [Candidatus Latescibacterota bacterium]
MEVLVVYDSFFGNTEEVAESIAGGIRSERGVETARTSDITPDMLNGLEYLIVGSPTRQFKPTGGVREFVSAIPRHGLSGIRVAAFDTRIDMDNQASGFLRFMVRIFGYAAGSISAKLRKKGGTVAALPEGFIVEGTEGPLR